METPEAGSVNMEMDRLQTLEKENADLRARVDQHASMHLEHAARQTWGCHGLRLFLTPGGVE